jgi:hypothetical protein
LEELLPVPRIYQEEVANATRRGLLTDEVAQQLPSFNECRSTAYRHRRQRIPPLPQTRENIILEGEWTETIGGDNFIIANDGEAEKLLIFGSVDGLLKAARAQTLYMDGTLYVAPDLFTQLYTVHAEYHNHSFPLLYGLLPGKQQVNYERFLRLISAAVGEHNINFRPAELRWAIQWLPFRQCTPPYQGQL